MVRVHYSGNDIERHWVPLGQLAGPWVEERRSCWDDGGTRMRRAHSIIDLQDAISIDHAPGALTDEMHAAGVGFIASEVASKGRLSNLKRHQKHLPRSSKVPRQLEEGTNE